MRCTAAALLALVCLLLTPAGCGSGAPDDNEPNDEPGEATVLAPGTPIEGAIGADDADVFRCDAPGGRTPNPFVVTVLTDAPRSIDLQVGASTPGAWEGITWPGWDAVAGEDRVEVAAGLRKGTVLMVLTGEKGTGYSIEIVWK